MILQALHELANHLKDTGQVPTDPDYEQVPIRFVLSLGPDGSGARILDTAELVETRPGSGKLRPKVKEMLIPRQKKLTSGNEAQFLVNGVEYIFGVDLNGKREPAKLSARVADFRSQVENIREHVVEDHLAQEALGALLTFLNQPDSARRKVLTEFVDSAGGEQQQKAMIGILSQAKFAIQFEPSAPLLIHDLKGIGTFWKRTRSALDETAIVRCLVSGEHGPAARNLPRIKGVPGGNAADAALVSCEDPAYWSHGWKRFENSPIIRDTAEACASALNWLLRPDNRRRVNLGKNSVALFWARDGEPVDFIFGLGDDQESVRALLEAPHTARRPAIQRPDDFFTAIVSGAQARGTLRSFLNTSTSVVHGHVHSYLKAIEIERPERRGALGIYTIRSLLDSLCRKGRDGADVPSALAVGLYLAAVYGLPPPASILQAAVRRNKAEASTDPASDSGRDKWSRFAARCSLIRLSLIRPPYNQEELAVSLDVQNRQPPYLLGRLLAVLDAIQRDVSPKINTTIVDRFFGAASSTPMVVFPSLLRLNQHHLSKLRKEKPGLAVGREKLLQDAVSGVRAFPRTMTLEAQGLFALGFHHQRQALFTKKIQIQATETN